MMPEVKKMSVDGTHYYRNEQETRYLELIERSQFPARREAFGVQARAHRKIGGARPPQPLGRLLEGRGLLLPCLLLVAGNQVGEGVVAGNLPREKEEREGGGARESKINQISSRM